MSSPSSEVAASVLDAPPSEAAYEKRLSQIEAIPEDELMPINVDLVSLVTSMVGAMPEIRAMRNRILESLGNFDLELFDAFEDYVLALNHANALYRISHAARRDTSEQVERVQGQRELLLASANVLAQFGLMDAKPIEHMKGIRSHRDLAGDVLALVALHKANWDNISNKVPLTFKDLNVAATDAFDLQRALGLKEQAPALRQDAAIRRRQAFTLFRRAYDPIRRAALYLYGEDAASEIVPKLTAGRVNAYNAEEEQEAVEEFDPEAAQATTRGGSERVPAGTTLVVDNPEGLPLTSVFEAG